MIMDMIIDYGVIPNTFLNAFKDITVVSLRVNIGRFLYWQVFLGPFIYT